MMEKAVAWGREHPVLLGVLVFGVGLLLLWWFGFFGGSKSSGDNTAGAYYAAETAANQAAVAQETARDQNQTNVAGINAGQAVQLAQIGAAKDVAMQNSADQLAAANLNFAYLSHASDTTSQIAFSNNATAEHIASINGLHAENVAIASNARDITIAHNNVEITALNDAVAQFQSQQATTLGLAQIQGANYQAGLNNQLGNKAYESTNYLAALSYNTAQLSAQEQQGAWDFAIAQHYALTN